MAQALDRAPLGPARCALTFAMVERRIAEIQRVAAPEGGYFAFAGLFVVSVPELDAELEALHLAAGLLEAALRWYFETLHTAALATWES